MTELPRRATPLRRKPTPSHTHTHSFGMALGYIVVARMVCEIKERTKSPMNHKVMRLGSLSAGSLYRHSQKLGFVLLSPIQLSLEKTWDSLVWQSGFAFALVKTKS